MELNKKIKFISTLIFSRLFSTVNLKKLSKHFQFLNLTNLKIL